MSQFCNRVFLVVFVRAVVGMAPAAFNSGCLESSTKAAVAPSVDYAQLLIEADEHSQQPDLPNDLQKPEGAAPTEVASKIEVTVYGPPGCPPCNKAIKEGNESKRFHFVKQDNIPPRIQEFADKWNRGGFPIVVFLDAKGEERAWYWMGLDDFEKRYDRTVPKKANLRKAVQAGSVAGVIQGFFGSHPRRKRCPKC